MAYVDGLVSVLIPLYNRAKYIDETITSALKQEYSHIEIIVVDDGSTDGGDKLVEAYCKDYPVTLYRHPGNVNLGQSISLNLALTKARGEFIAILDSDDIFLPNKLSEQVTFLRENPDVDLVYGMGYGVNADGEIVYEILCEAHEEKNDPNRVLLDCYFHLPVSSLLRRKVFDLVGGFDESLRAGQDHDMQVRMAEKIKLGFLPRRVYHYRRHGDSISSTGLERRWRNANIILDKAVKRFNYRTETVRKRRAIINFRLAQVLWSQKTNRIEAARRFIYSGLLDPLRALRVITRQEKIK